MVDSPYFAYAFALLLALPFLIFFRQFVFNYIKLKNQEIKLLAVKGTGGQRSAAYERLTLFLERLKPAALIQRFDSGLEPHEFIFLVDKMIKEEFEYNLSQQLYLSKNAWAAVAACKNNMLQLLQKTHEGLSETATLEDFKTIFIMNYLNSEDYISETLELLRRENLILN